MIRRERITYYQCDHPGCGEVSWIGKAWDWKMCEIVFGTHPKIIKKREEEHKTSIIQEHYHFCRMHAPMYEDILYALMARAEYMAREEIVGSAYFEEGLGCWITIHNCLVVAPIKNFQMGYEAFEQVHQSFPPAAQIKAYLDRAKSLRELPGSSNFTA